MKSFITQHWRLFVQVQSLFENERSKRINGLDHSLLLYEKIFGPNGRVQIVKSPIPLKDLFKNRQLNPGTLTDKVKRVLLFSNPGTGELNLILYLLNQGVSRKNHCCQEDRLQMVY